MNRLSNKAPSEVVPVEFKFSGLLVGVASAVVSVEVVDGADQDPAQILLGSPIISGSSVIQRVRNGLPFVDYLIKCTGTSGQDTYVVEAVLPVRPEALS